MVVGPGAIGCDLVCEFAAPRIGEHQNAIVDPLYSFQDRVAGHLVVERVFVNLIEHVRAYGRVVRIGDYSAAEESLYERVGEADADCVDEDVTWRF